MWWLLWVPLGFAAYFGLAIGVGKLFAVGMGTHPNSPHPDRAGLDAPFPYEEYDRTAIIRIEPRRREDRAVLAGAMSAIGAILAAIFTVP